MLCGIAVLVNAVCIVVYAELEPEVLACRLTNYTSVGLAVSHKHSAELLGYGSVVVHLGVGGCVTVGYPVIEHILAVYHKLVVFVNSLRNGLIRIELSVAEVVSKKKRCIVTKRRITDSVVSVGSEVNVYVGIIAVLGLVEIGCRITEDVRLNGNLFLIYDTEILEVYGIVTCRLNVVLVVCEGYGVGCNLVLVCIGRLTGINVGTAGLVLVAYTCDRINILTVNENVKHVSAVIVVLS